MSAERKTQHTEREAAQRALRERVEATSLVSLWDHFEDVVSHTTAPFRPHVWRWDDIRPLLLEAGNVVSLDEADRRAIILANPGVFPKHFTTTNLYVAYQLVGPGETAAVHRHTPSASRFVLEGNGGYTVVEGEKCPMERGDLILTPQGTWHDHGNDGKAPAIWVDVLDLPVVDHLGAIYFDFDYAEGSREGGEPARRRMQTVQGPPGYSNAVYGAAGLMPTYVSHQRGDGIGSPKFVYPWKETLRAIEELRSRSDGDPFDGIILRYTDPVSGDSVSPTMDFTVQMLAAGQATRMHRHTSSTVYTCLEGRGRSVAGSETLHWAKNDTFVVPSWAWHKHENVGDSDAVLYGVSDMPIAKKLGLYREQGEGEPDGAWRTPAPGAGQSWTVR